MARAKRKLPAKPAGFVFSHHRGHSCHRHPIPEHKDPAAVNNTHPTKITARSNVINRYPNTKTPLPLRTPPAAFISPQHRRHFCRRQPAPERKKLRCRSEHRRPVLFFRITAVTPAAVIRFPNTKTPPPSTIHTPQKSRPGQTSSTDARTQKKTLPLRTPPADFISPQHRSHFCRRHPIPEHKAPAADDNTHPTKTSRPGQTSSTDARTQKLRCRSERRRSVLFFRITAVTSAAVIRYPNTKPPPPTTIHTPQKPTARSNGTDRRPNTKKPAAAPNTTGRFRFL